MPLEDYVKPLKLEHGEGQDLDFIPTEADPNEDGLLAAGFAVETSAITIDKDTNSNLRFKDPNTGSITLSELLGATTLSQSEIQAHISDSDIHFTESSIVHSNIIGVGSYSHSSIDAHIDDSDLHTGIVDHSDLSGIGTYTHDDLDSHVDDATIHFTEDSINHSNIQNIGTYTHSAVDSHIDNGLIHFYENAINHSNIQNIGTYTHDEIDSHIDDLTIHFTEGSIVHSNIQGMSYLDSGHIGFERDAFEYSSNPTATNDGADTAGVGRAFQVSEQWVNTSNNLVFVCTDNTTSDASWLAVTEFQDRQMARSSALATTTSPTYQDLPGMSLTTRDIRDNGKYYIGFSATIQCSKKEQACNFIINVGGADIATSERTIVPFGAFYDELAQAQAYVSGIGTGTIIKVRYSVGSDTLLVYERNLFIDGVPERRVI